MFAQRAHRILFDPDSVASSQSAVCVHFLAVCEPVSVECPNSGQL